MKTRAAAVNEVENVLLECCTLEAYCPDETGDVYLECKCQVGSTAGTPWKAQRGYVWEGVACATCGKRTPSGTTCATCLKGARS